jgi:regulator of sigma E protease
MNYLLAMVILFSLYFFAGGKVLTDPDRVLVGDVKSDAPAELAGLKSGDQIIAVNGEVMTTMDSVRRRINALPAEQIELIWVHEGDTITKFITTLAEPVRNAEGGLDTLGLIGFAEKILGREQYSLGGELFVTGEISMKAVGGPIFIATQSGEQARRGAYALFFFMALLSVNLAILNVLPIPILDGGHLVFLALEKLRGSPLSIKARTWAQQIGLVVILGLILLVTYNDVIRVVRGY